VSAVFFVYSVRSACSECGESLVFDGPTRAVTCESCQSVVEIDPQRWGGILSFRESCAEFSLTEGLTRNSSILNTPGFHVKWGPQRPLCAKCNGFVDYMSRPAGFDGDIFCRGCGHGTPTYPVPDWLRKHQPQAFQIFGAPREGAAAPAVEKPNPISFQCPDCGANLKIAAEDQRVVTCKFCKADLFLPAALWIALHPKKKRTPWYVAFAG
jgi:ribosomal protein S27E